MGSGVRTEDDQFEIQSEAHGPHWIAWLTRAATGEGHTGGPDQAIVLVGASKEDAEARAREWGRKKAETGSQK